MELTAGTKVTANVRLVRKLGEGGMGSVWVADHLGLDTQVAVKFISPELVAENPAVVKRFKREASASAKIKSPHVVRAFDHGLTEDGTPYIVMELLEGENLAEHLHRVGLLSLRQVERLIKHVSRALRKAHKLGIVHRDIKPENLYLVDAGRFESDDEPTEDEMFVKVLDFGIAKETRLPASSAMTRSGAMVGTLEYMSPEQIESPKNVDRQCDLWALAVVAYWALTGRVPFTGETLGGICIAIAEAKFTPVGELRAVPPELDEWFKRAFDPDPDNRFGSATQMVNAYSRAVAEPGVEIVDEVSVDTVSSPGLFAETDDFKQHHKAALAPTGLADGPAATVATPGAAAPPSDRAGVAESGEPSEDGETRTSPEPVSSAPRARFDAVAPSAPNQGTLEGASSTLHPAGLPRASRSRPAIGAIVVVVAVTVGIAIWWLQRSPEATPASGQSVPTTTRAEHPSAIITSGTMAQTLGPEPMDTSTVSARTSDAAPAPGDTTAPGVVALSSQTTALPSPSVTATATSAAGQPGPPEPSNHPRSTPSAKTKATPADPIASTRPSAGVPFIYESR